MPSLAQLNLPVDTSVVDRLIQAEQVLAQDDGSDHLATAQFRSDLGRTLADAVSTLNAMGNYCDGQRADREKAERDLRNSRLALVMANGTIDMIKALVNMDDDRG